MGGDPFYLKFWVNRPPLEQNRRFWTDNRSYSASAVAPTEKSSINANRKSTTRFPMRLRWSSYVAPESPKGGLKNAKRPIFVKKSHFAWRKSATKFLCVKTVGGKVVRHSLAYNYPCKNDWWEATPCTWNFESNWPHWSEIWTISCDNSETVRDRMSVTINH